MFKLSTGSRHKLNSIAGALGLKGPWNNINS